MSSLFSILQNNIYLTANIILVLAKTYLCKREDIHSIYPFNHHHLVDTTDKPANGLCSFMSRPLYAMYWIRNHVNIFKKLLYNITPFMNNEHKPLKNTAKNYPWFEQYMIQVILGKSWKTFNLGIWPWNNLEIIIQL